MLHGATLSATLSAKVADIQHRRSPLTQGGLEIPIELKITMTFSDKNQLYVKKYESLISERYKEPIQGKFEDATADILRNISADCEEDDIVKDKDSSCESDIEVF